jgi:hypothetical protein
VVAQAGAHLVTSNSIPHESNGIDVTEPLANSIKEFLSSPSEDSILKTYR